ncbi:uncharacterized protein MONOS_3377 [Monocercomonoides exilis]|uniref:uncharacterized protein n=1 Tax=Monocercomonoides exilis TaxID=2049356 RepID=UPI00355953C2|nr:hypothetical protein MONOS_3377 [Monocercomonoides exilis]|eukprot:MONOS_3377.1-p1 / transcript=MONOS_3377.1 / gene=MONOS_3377 / organism=Monocercomonoides_exilis_PA203 / gene_product=unspecified product / transcript_product=unspecified product / location=Mono_scaffold00079:43428-45857(+) / protein_length=511 / sequence_SO=supercontig / SO=protein_coding / is_pseudo=false
MLNEKICQLGRIIENDDLQVAKKKNILEELALSLNDSTKAIYDENFEQLLLLMVKMLIRGQNHQLQSLIERIVGVIEPFICSKQQKIKKENHNIELNDFVCQAEKIFRSFVSTPRKSEDFVNSSLVIAHLNLLSSFVICGYEVAYCNSFKESLDQLLLSKDLSICSETTKLTFLLSRQEFPAGSEWAKAFSMTSSSSIQSSSSSSLSLSSSSSSSPSPSSSSPSPSSSSSSSSSDIDPSAAVASSHPSSSPPLHLQACKPSSEHTLSSHSLKDLLSPGSSSIHFVSSSPSRISSSQAAVSHTLVLRHTAVVVEQKIVSGVWKVCGRFLGSPRSVGIVSTRTQLRDEEELADHEDGLEYFLAGYLYQGSREVRDLAKCTDQPQTADPSLKLVNSMSSSSSPIPSSSSPSSSSSFSSTPSVSSQCVSVEIDMMSKPRRVTFFADGNKISCSVTHIPDSVFFGLSFYERNSSFVVDSFQEMASPTVVATDPDITFRWNELPQDEASDYFDEVF